MREHLRHGVRVPVPEAICKVAKVWPEAVESDMLGDTAALSSLSDITGQRLFAMP